MPKTIKDPPSINDYMRVLSSLVGMPYDPHGENKTMLVPTPTAMMPGFKRSEAGTRLIRGMAPFADDLREAFPYPSYVRSMDASNPFVRMEETAHTMQRATEGGGTINPDNIMTNLRAAQKAIRESGKVMKETGDFGHEDIKNRRQYKKKMKQYFGYRNPGAAKELEAKAATVKAGMITEGLIPEGHQFTKEDLPAVENWIYNTLGPSYMNALMQARGTEKGSEALVTLLNAF